MRAFVKGMAFTGLVTGALALTTGALAAGEPRRSLKDTELAPFSWTGFYLGANIGYAWGQSDASSSSDCPATGYYCAPGFVANGPAIAALGSGSLDPSGPTGGVQAGYNLQSGKVVLGGEVDFNAFRLSSSRFASANIPAAGSGQSFGAGSSIDTNWLFTARLRLGLAVTPSALVYVTGGLAATDLAVANSYSDTASAVVGTNGRGSATSTSTKAGWTVGGGVEWALNRNWTLKGEYLYVDFGNASVTSRVTNPSPLYAGRSNDLSTSTDLTAHIARVGLNYKF